MQRPQTLRIGADGSVVLGAMGRATATGDNNKQYVVNGEAERTFTWISLQNSDKHLVQLRNSSGIIECHYLDVTGSGSSKKVSSCATAAPHESRMDGATPDRSTGSPLPAPFSRIIMNEGHLHTQSTIPVSLPGPVPVSLPSYKRMPLLPFSPDLLSSSLAADNDHHRRGRFQPRLAVAMQPVILFWDWTWRLRPDYHQAAGESESLWQLSSQGLGPGGRASESRS